MKKLMRAMFHYVSSIDKNIEENKMIVCKSSRNFFHAKKMLSSCSKCVVRPTVIVYRKDGFNKGRCLICDKKENYRKDCKS